MIKIHCIPAFDDNYIWLIGEEGNSMVAAVDPGDADVVIAYLEREQLTLNAILVTHHHYDHTGGVSELASRYQIPVYGPSNEHIPALTDPVSEGTEIRLGDELLFTVLETPGHTRGHLCYVGQRTLFCGDTLFGAGCGRLFEGTPEQMYQSLIKIAALPDDTQVYCAHEYTLSNLRFALVAEPDNADILARQEQSRQLRQKGLPTVPSALALEKKTNPFLRSHIESLITAAETFAGHTLSTGAEVFATVRYWKDSLD